MSLIIPSNLYSLFTVKSFVKQSQGWRACQLVLSQLTSPQTVRKKIAYQTTENIKSWNLVLVVLHIRGGGNHPRKDTQPKISDLRDHSQSISRQILARVQKKRKKKRKKKLPPLYIDQLKCGIRPPPPPPDPRPPPPPPTLFEGPLCERTERDRDMKISGL